MFTFGYFGISVAVGKVRRVPQLNNIFRGILIINQHNSIWGKNNLQMVNYYLQYLLNRLSGFYNCILRRGWDLTPA